MNRSIETIFAIAFGILASGCAIDHSCDKRAKTIRPGWVAISGTVIPATTTEVEPMGKSLVNCLLDSRTVQILMQQRELQRESKPAATRRALSELDTKSLKQTLEKAETSQTPKSMYAIVVREVEALQLSYPNLLAGESNLNFAFDRKLSTPQDRARLQWQINSIAVESHRKAANQALASLNSTSENDTTRQESLQLLNQLAQRDILRLDDSQKSRSWTFARLAELDTSGTNTGLIVNDSAGSERSKAEAIVQLLVTNANQSLQATALAGGSGLEGDDPGEKLFAIVELQDNGVVIVPLNSVFDSAVGGLWLFPGDRVQITRLEDIGFLAGQLGAKRVGLTGLTSQRGIVETNASRLKPLLYEVDDLIDLRSDLVVVTYPAGANSIKLMMPYSPTPNSAGNAAKRATLLQDLIGLHHGSVVTLDRADMSPLLTRSRKLMERAADARIQYPPDHGCSAKAGSSGEKETSCNLQFPEVPVVSDTCSFVQQAGQDAWKSAQDWWETVVP